MNNIVIKFLIVLQFRSILTSYLAQNPSIQRFQEYLRIRSVQPNVNYDPCIKFIWNQANELNLPITIHEFSLGKPIAVITWVGTNPDLPSILLSSHMDVVVVVDQNQWENPPFEAKIENGNIYARGSQDMKSVGIQYLEAIRKLRNNNTLLKRTVHIIFTPDEETWGLEGIKLFVQSDAFKALNIGFGLDEGSASPYNNFPVYNGERIACTLTVTCHGMTGHGAGFIENTAAEKLNFMINKLLEFRTNERNKLTIFSNFADVTTVNLVKLEGGVANNIVPATLKAVFDVRLAPTLDAATFHQQLTDWSTEAGDNVNFVLRLKTGTIPVTKLDESNPWWVAFKSTADELGMELVPQIMAGTTDSVYMRRLGIPVLSFSPINGTKVLAHGNDEYLGVDTFLRGIEIYKKIIKSLGNINSF